MNIKDVLEYDKHSVSIHRLDFLQSLVGNRYISIESLEEQFPEKVKLINSESDIIEDHILDGEFDEYNSFTLFYILDNSGKMYIRDFLFFLNFPRAKTKDS